MKIGTTELLVILVIVLLVVGPTQLPKLMKMFGKSVKKAQSGISNYQDADSSESSGSDDAKDT